MIKKNIEHLLGFIENSIFEEALKMTESDIKINRIQFNILTSMEDFLCILMNCIRTLKRC